MENSGAVMMMPGSGVLAYDNAARAYPVVGWYTYSPDAGGVVVMPLVLNRGRLEPLNDADTSYDVVGTNSQDWVRVLAWHNASGGNGQH